MALGHRLQLEYSCSGGGPALPPSSFRADSRNRTRRRRNTLTAVSVARSAGDDAASSRGISRQSRKSSLVVGSPSPSPPSFSQEATKPQKTVTLKTCHNTLNANEALTHLHPCIHLWEKTNERNNFKCSLSEISKITLSRSMPQLRRGAWALVGLPREREFLFA